MRGRKGLAWGDPAPCSALWPQNLTQITVRPPLVTERVGGHSTAQRCTPTAEWWRQPCSQGSGPRGGPEAQRVSVCPVAAGLGGPRKAGKQRLSEPVKQQEVALGEKSGPETRSWAHLGASWGPGGHSAQALCLGPKVTLGHGSPRLVIPSEGIYPGSRVAQEGRGPPNHTGGHSEVGPAPALPARRGGFSVSTGPPGLQASPTGAGDIAAPLPPLQNLGWPRIPDCPGARPWAGRWGRRGGDIWGHGFCWLTSQPGIPGPLYDSGGVLRCSAPR